VVLRGGGHQSACEGKKKKREKRKRRYYMDIMGLIQKKIEQDKVISGFINKNRKTLMDLDLYFFFKELPRNRQLEFISRWGEIQQKYK
jgi:hypothetical protein